MNRAARTGLVLCCCVVSTLLFSGFFIASHADHDCLGEECPLCLLAQMALNFSRQLKQIPAFPVVPPLLVSPLAAGFRFFCTPPASSVRLKVRINR
ncbi:MAG: hypothetical protein LBD96_01050 [Treponema sp.]|nr:hypothetical protein [Treponema sp.]